MKLSKSQGLTQPFVLEASDLEKLCEKLQEVTPKLDFEISCKDDLKREFPTLEEFLKFDNAPKREIQKLRISGFSEDLKTRVWIKYDKDPRSNFFVSIEGDEKSAPRLDDYIDEHLASLKPWYSLIARTDFGLIATIVWVSLFLGILIATGIRKPSAFRESFSLNAGEVFMQVLVGALSTLVPVTVGFILNKIRASVFPMGVFGIGQGVKRHKDKEILRTGVIVAFFVSFISSITVALIFAI